MRALGWLALLLLPSVAIVAAGPAPGSAVGAGLRAGPAPSRLLIAFASFRERRQHPKVYFYEHDGVDQGKIIGSIDTVNQRSDYRPALSHDGRYCAFASELENQTGKILFWDRQEKKLIDLPKLNETPNAQMSPGLSG